MSKDLFKQAIAEAKSVREAAIANAKEALRNFNSSSKRLTCCKATRNGRFKSRRNY